MGKVVEIDCEKSIKLETSRNVTKSKRSLHWCRSISKKYMCTFYYSISKKVITLSGRRFITVSGVLLHYPAVITLSGVFYYIIGQLLQYRAFITLSVGTSTMRTAIVCRTVAKSHDWQLILETLQNSPCEVVVLIMFFYRVLIRTTCSNFTARV